MPVDLNLLLEDVRAGSSMTAWVCSSFTPSSELLLALAREQEWTAQEATSVAMTVARKSRNVALTFASQYVVDCPDMCHTVGVILGRMATPEEYWNLRNVFSSSHVYPGFIAMNSPSEAEFGAFARWHKVRADRFRLCTLKRSLLVGF